MISRFSKSVVRMATGDVAVPCARTRTADAGVLNAFAQVGVLEPATLNAMLDTSGALAARTLNEQDVETIKLVVGVVIDCSHSATTHNFSKSTGIAPDAIQKIRNGEPTGDAKRDALVTFVRALASISETITDDPFAAMKAAGCTDQQLVDITLAISVGIFTDLFTRIRRNERRFSP